MRDEDPQREWDALGPGGRSSIRALSASGIVARAGPARRQPAERRLAVLLNRATCATSPMRTPSPADTSRWNRSWAAPPPVAPAPHARLQPAGGRSRRCARDVMGRRRAARDAHRSGHAHDRAQTTSTTRRLRGSRPGCRSSALWVRRPTARTGRPNGPRCWRPRPNCPRRRPRDHPRQPPARVPHAVAPLCDGIRHPHRPRGSRSRAPTHRRTGASERTLRASPGACDGCATPRTA